MFITTAPVNNNIGEDGDGLIVQRVRVGRPQIKLLGFEPISVVLTVDAVSRHLIREIDRNMVRHASFTCVDLEEVVIVFDESVESSVERRFDLRLVHGYTRGLNRPGIPGDSIS